MVLFSNYTVFYNNYWDYLRTVESYYNELKDLATIFSWLPLIQIRFLALFVLALAVFLPAGPELSRRVLRTLGASLFRIFLISVYDVVPRFAKPGYFIKWTQFKHTYLGEDIIQTNGRHLLGGDEIINTPVTEGYVWEIPGLTDHFILADPLYSHLFLGFAILVINLLIFSISEGRSVWPSGEIEFPLLVLLLGGASIAILHVDRLIDLVRLLEIATLGIYVLVGYERTNRFSALAAVQYFILGTIPSAALILSVALIYQAWGGLTFHELERLTSTAGVELPTPALAYTTGGHNAVDLTHPKLLIPSLFEDLSVQKSKEFSFAINFSPRDSANFRQQFSSTNYSYLPRLATCLIFFNLLFKLTAAPFHFWAPSVYGNAPLATVTFVSILSKAFVLAIRAKLLWTFFFRIRLLAVPLLLIVSILSAFGGILGAMVEQRAKRFYVYSSRGHVGFRLAGLSFLYLSGLGAQFHYLAVYIVTSYAIWFFLRVLGPSATHLVHFARLKQYPELGIFLTFLLFSISGLPPLAGFYAKLDVFIALLESSHFFIAYLLYFFSVASFFYYLRLIKIFFFDSNARMADEKWETFAPKPLLWLLSFLTLAILLYGIFVERPLLLSQREALASLL